MNFGLLMLLKSRFISSSFSSYVFNHFSS